MRQHLSLLNCSFVAREERKPSTMFSQQHKQADINIKCRWLQCSCRMTLAFSHSEWMHVVHISSFYRHTRVCTYDFRCTTGHFYAEFGCQEDPVYISTRMYRVLMNVPHLWTDGGLMQEKKWETPAVYWNCRSRLHLYVPNALLIRDQPQKWSDSF